MTNILLFRVSTNEILDELKYRLTYRRPNNFEEISSEDLLKHILEQRIDSFRY